MAKKYLKYFVTREDQYISDEFIEYMKSFPKDKHLLNTMSDHTWHLYEMIQNAFYCNWPNTNCKKYFIQANLLVLNNNLAIKDSEPYEYFGLLFVNPKNHKLTFKVDRQKQELQINKGLLLMSPHMFEEYTITGDSDMLMVKFKINCCTGQENWIPF